GCARDICLDGRLCRVRVACLRDRRGGAGWARAAILAALPGEPGRAPKCRAAGPGAPMTRKRRRLVTVLAGLVALSAATALVLAKRDEKYMPPEVAEALKKSGRWQEGGTSSGKPAALPAKAP